MATGPLSAHFDAWNLAETRAGTSTSLHVELENTGTAAWDATIFLGYHWLDSRDNPIVWDGDRTPLPALKSGEKATVEARVRAPIPPGSYRFTPDLVAEHRAWFSELGSKTSSAEVEVLPREGAGVTGLPSWVETTPEREKLVAAAHAEGYGVVAGSIEWQGAFGRRRPKELAAYEPGTGRIMSFAHALICPSVLPGVTLERLPDVAGLPAFAAPTDEPWLYDGRAVLRARPSAR